VISGNSDAIYQRLMRLVGRTDLADDPTLADNAGRVARAAELDEAIASWTAALPCADVLRALEEAAVPSGPIYTAADILDDPHYRARGMHERHPVALGEGEKEEVVFPGIVPRLEDHPGVTRWLGPDLGEHTDSVLSSLGVGTARLAELRGQGVL
jgi:formyl-CoA transferase